MGEGLGEVAEMVSAGGVDLFGVEAEGAGEPGFRSFETRGTLSLSTASLGGAHLNDSIGYVVFRSILV